MGLHGFLNLLAGSSNIVLIGSEQGFSTALGKAQGQ